MILVVTVGDALAVDRCVHRPTLLDAHDEAALFHQRGGAFFGAVDQDQGGGAAELDGPFEGAVDQRDHGAVGDVDRGDVFVGIADVGVGDAEVPRVRQGDGRL